SNTGRAVTWCPIHLRMALPNNASAGSAAATRPAISGRATRLTRLSCNVGRFLSAVARLRRVIDCRFLLAFSPYRKLGLDCAGFSILGFGMAQRKETPTPPPEPPPQ